MVAQPACTAMRWLFESRFGPTMLYQAVEPLPKKVAASDALRSNQSAKYGALRNNSIIASWLNSFSSDHAETVDAVNSSSASA